ncbi:hypothetical protein PSP6_630042 [Paraburkholderia tropica]|nr:hypothetical protein PSP6_630042 [Paraburkholderia tropica]
MDTVSGNNLYSRLLISFARLSTRFNPRKHFSISLRRNPYSNWLPAAWSSICVIALRKQRAESASGPHCKAFQGIANHDLRKQYYYFAVCAPFTANGSAAK